MSRSLRARFSWAYIIGALGAAGAIWLVLDPVVVGQAREGLRARLVSQAQLAGAATQSLSGAQLQQTVLAMASAGGSDLAVAGAGGIILASSAGPQGAQNPPPEVAAALRGARGESLRTGSRGGRYLFVAVPAPPSRVVSAGSSTAPLEQARTLVRWFMAGTTAVLCGAALAAARFGAGSVSRPLAALAQEVARMGSQPPRPVGGPPAEVEAMSASLARLASELDRRLGALKSESALREQILSAMPDGVLLTDSTGKVLYANRVATDLLDGAGRSVSQLGAEPYLEMTVHHPHRRELRAANIVLEKGRRLLVVQDVTEAKRIEAMRRDFVADASHELKTPVASIQAVAETLTTALQEDPEVVPRFSQTLLQEARRLSAIVQDLLDLARLEAGPSARDAVSLTDVTRAEVAKARGPAEAKGLRLLADVGDGVDATGSRNDLSLAVRNLLDNAVRYTPAGQVSVSLHPDQGQAILAIEDTGMGIPRRDLARVFERFFRVDKARSRETGGTGLGLSIVRHVVEQHGGTIRVESELGRGSRFVMSLPLAQPEGQPGPDSPQRS